MIKCNMICVLKCLLILNHLLILNVYEKILIRRNLPEHADEFFRKARNYQYQSQGKDKTAFWLDRLWGHGTSPMKVLRAIGILIVLLISTHGALTLLGITPNMGNWKGYLSYVGNFVTGSTPESESITSWGLGITIFYLCFQILLLNLFFASLVRKFLRS